MTLKKTIKVLEPAISKAFKLTPKELKQLNKSERILHSKKFQAKMAARKIKI